MKNTWLGFVLVSLLSLALVAACGADDDGGDTGDGTVDSGGGVASPDLTGVTWTFAVGCTPNQPSDVTITMTVEDADTAEDALSYSGMVTGCTGQVTSNPATISCPNIQPYSGTITVMDPEG
ncbi:MAG TPA: hypothetical protein VKZ63_22740, partial [Kofleriaceae bacterium]|nr:hypothetical protein [Kofleriaceae bacterium]